MNRLKVLLFAVVVLGLWAYHLTLVGPAVTEHAAENAMASIAGVPGSIAWRLEAQRSDLQAAVLKLSTNPALLLPQPKAPAAGAPAAKPEAPSADKLNALRAAVTEALGDKKAQAVVGLSNEAGALVSVAGGEPAAAPEGLDVAALVQAGGAGAQGTVGGVPYLFYALPLYVADKTDVKPAAHCFVGLPLLPDAKAMVEAVAKDVHASVGLMAGTALIASSGDKAALEKAGKGKTGLVTASAGGSVDSFFGLVALPVMAGSPVQEVGLNQELTGTPYRVVASASTKAAVQALAGYQKFALSALVGLLLLAIVMTLLVGGAVEEEGARMSVPPPMPVPPKKVEEPTVPSPIPAGAITGQEPAHAPEVSPDDFQFPSSPSTVSAPPPPPPAPAAPPPAPVAPPPQAFAPPPPPPPAQSYAPPAPPPGGDVVALPGAGPAADPFAMSTSPATHSPFAPTNRAPAPAMPFDSPDDEGGRTSAYPSFKPPAAAMAQARPSSPPPPPMNDPFAMAAAQGGDEDAQPQHDDADSTRVAMVPQELLKSSKSGVATGMTGNQQAFKPPPAPSISMPRVAAVGGGAGVSEEEKHFQDVFRDFVATREKCGEPADGLTFDKFKAKLLKNKEQLVSKYNCKSVRFQVYVKEGKAALKASPVKD